jgi:hypothetical protein
MPQLCQQFWPCNAVPPEYVWLMPTIMPLLAIVLLGVPVASILHRAGRSRCCSSVKPNPFALWFC